MRRRRPREPGSGCPTHTPLASVDDDGPSAATVAALASRIGLKATPAFPAVWRAPDPQKTRRPRTIIEAVLLAETVQAFRSREDSSGRLVLDGASRRTLPRCSACLLVSYTPLACSALKRVPKGKNRAERRADSCRNSSEHPQTCRAAVHELQE